MKTYEITYMTVLEEGNDAKSIAPILASHSSKIMSVHPWGNRRKLTYPIKKQDQAFFTTVVLEAEPSSIAGLQREIHLSNDVLRALIVEFEPGIFHRSASVEDKAKAGEKSPLTEATAEATTAEPQPEPAVAEPEKAKRETAEVTPEAEPKPKKRRATKTTTSDEKSLDEKLDALLNEDITK